MRADSQQSQHNYQQQTNGNGPNSLPDVRQMLSPSQTAPAPAPAPEAAPAEEPVPEPVVALPTPREPDQAPEAEATPVPVAPVEDQGQELDQGHDAEPVVAQHAEDLDTRAADQEESTAAVAETREPAGPAAPGYDDAEREAFPAFEPVRDDTQRGTEYDAA